MTDSMDEFLEFYHLNIYILQCCFLGIQSLQAASDLCEMVFV